MPRIIISGALGHMGRAVAQNAKAVGCEVSAGVDMAQGNAEFPLYTSFAELPKDAGDVIIDFSSPAVLKDLLDYAAATGTPAVLCTTGYTDADLAAIDEASAKVALFRSANMSLGIALLKALCRTAARVLGEAYDVEITETHHNRKKDAPSGTALALYDAIRNEYEQPRELVNGRSGRDCKRTHNEIGMHALRGGTVAGNHEVWFLGESERICLSHMAENRSVFASGAVRAACFLAQQAPGMYAMEDIVGNL